MTSMKDPGIAILTNAITQAARWQTHANSPVKKDYIKALRCLGDDVTINEATTAPIRGEAFAVFVETLELSFLLVGFSWESTDAHEIDEILVSPIDIAPEILPAAVVTLTKRILNLLKLEYEKDKAQ